MQGLVRYKHERRCSRARGAGVSFWDVTIETPDRKYDRGMWMTSWPEAWAEIWEKSVSWVLPRKKTVDFRLLAETGQWPCGRWFGADGKVSIERWYLSPYVEKPYNSKVIKSFVPELRSRKCFSVSGFLCYLYMDIMNVLRTGMNMSISHIRIWQWYTSHVLFVLLRWSVR